MLSSSQTSVSKSWPTVSRGLPRKAWEGFQEQLGKGVYRTTSKSVIQKGAIFSGYTDDYPFRNLSMNIAHLRNAAFVPCSYNSQTVSPPDFYFHLIAAIMLQKDHQQDVEGGGGGRVPLPDRIVQLLDQLHNEVAQRQQQQSEGGSGGGFMRTMQPRSKLIDLYPNLPVVTLSEIKAQERAFDYAKPVKFARSVAKKSFFHVMTVDDLLAFYAELPRFAALLSTLQATKQREKSSNPGGNQSALSFNTQSVDSMLEQHEISLSAPVTMLNGDTAQHKMGVSVHELYGVSVYLKYDVITPGGFHYPFAKVYLDSNEVNFLLERRRFILGELYFIQDANVALTGKATYEEADRDQVLRNKEVKTVYHTEEIISKPDGSHESIISCIEIEDPWPTLPPQQQLR